MAGLRHVGTLGRLIIWHRIRLILFKIFSVDDWQTLGGACQNCGEFLEEVSCTWKPDFTSRIFSIVPMAS